MARDPVQRSNDPSGSAGGGAEAAFAIVEPLRRLTPVVFASPHSGRRYPPDLLASARAPLLSLRRSEDAFVDELFAGVAGAGAPLLTATYARAYVDLNRSAGDLDPNLFHDSPRLAALSPRAKAGLGVIPRICGDGQPIYRGRLPFAMAKARLERVHAPYHAALAALLAETRAAFGCALLIDCHSMPSAARGAGAPDIVLGDRYGAACDPSITLQVETTLKRLGYRVARNAPFAGGYITQTHGRPTGGVHALQVEISRGLYLDERTLERTPGFERVRADMTTLAQTLGRLRIEERLAQTS